MCAGPPVFIASALGMTAGPTAPPSVLYSVPLDRQRLKQTDGQTMRKTRKQKNKARGKEMSGILVVSESVVVVGLLFPMITRADANHTGHNIYMRDPCMT